VPFVVFCDGKPSKKKEVEGYLSGLEQQGLLFRFRQDDLICLFEEEYGDAFNECCGKFGNQSSEKGEKGKSPAVAYCVASRTDPPDEVKRLVKSLRVLLGSSGVGG